MVTVTPQQIERAEAALSGIRGGASKVLARSVNRAVLAARAELVRQVKGAYNVKAAAVRETLKIRRASPGDPTAEVRSTGKRISLYAFGSRPRVPGTGGPGRSPLAVATYRGEGRKPIAGAFVAAMQPGQVGIYRRKGTARLPVSMLHGPSIPQMAGRGGIAQAIEERAQATLSTRLDHEIGRMLEGAA